MATKDLGNDTVKIFDLKGIKLTWWIRNQSYAGIFRTEIRNAGWNGKAIA